MNDYLEKDLKLAAYLLASKEVEFTGTSKNGPTVFFHFSPKEKAEELVSAYFTKSGEKVDAKTLLDALEEARTILFREKEKSTNGDYYGQNYR